MTTMLQPSTTPLGAYPTQVSSLAEGGAFRKFSKHVILPEDSDGCFILSLPIKAKGYPGFYWSVDYNLDVTLLLRVLIETGLRPGEGCALRVNSLRGEGWIEAKESINQYGTVGPTKTGQIFNRVVSEELYALLVAHAGERFGNEFLFRKKNASPFRPTELSNIWRKAGKAAGRAIPLNHSMRHSRISQEINEKLRDEYRAKVRGILGHKSTVTALKYVRPKAEGK